MNHWLSWQPWCTLECIIWLCDSCRPPCLILDTWDWTLCSAYRTCRTVTFKHTAYNICCSTEDEMSLLTDVSSDVSLKRQETKWNTLLLEWNNTISWVWTLFKTFWISAQLNRICHKGQVIFRPFNPEMVHMISLTVRFHFSYYNSSVTPLLIVHIFKMKVQCVLELATSRIQTQNCLGHHITIGTANCS